MITREEYNILKKVKKLFNERCNYNVGCPNCELCKFCNETPDVWDFSEIEKNFIITKEEYTILNNFDSNYKNYYISRHFLGDICISKEKPFKVGTEVLSEGGEFLEISMFNHLFKIIRYEDEEPKRIIDYIREYELWEEKKNENKKD